MPSERIPQGHPETITIMAAKWSEVWAFIANQQQPEAPRTFD